MYRFDFKNFHYPIGVNLIGTFLVCRKVGVNKSLIRMPYDGTPILKHDAYLWINEGMIVAMVQSNWVQLTYLNEYGNEVGHTLSFSSPSFLMEVLGRYHISKVLSFYFNGRATDLEDVLAGEWNGNGH